MTETDETEKEMQEAANYLVSRETDFLALAAVGAVHKSMRPEQISAFALIGIGAELRIANQKATQYPKSSEENELRRELESARHEIGEKNNLLVKIADALLKDCFRQLHPVESAILRDDITKHLKKYAPK